MKFEDIGVAVPEILLPKKGTDMKKWSVVACDQYTSQPEYWEDAKKIIGDAPSSLELIFPEVYLDGDDEQEIIDDINKKMNEYLEGDVFDSPIKGFIALDRKTSHSPSRKGLMVALDLEKYEYTEGAKTLIRASEGTIVERLKPRIKIRENASLELPHIMVLIDDPEKRIIEPLFEKDLSLVYDTDLMLEGGHIKGWLVDDKEDINNIAEGLASIADSKHFNEKYDLNNEEVLLYAMGDGNHSFATAKALWERVKSDASDKDGIMNHPARYALVELVNIHDEGIIFEPIHRVLFNADRAKFVADMEKYYSEKGAEVNFINCPDEAQMEKVFNIEIVKEGVHAFPFISKGQFSVISVSGHNSTLEVENLQSFLDEFINNNEGVEVDYVHGRDVVMSLSEKDGNLGFLLPTLDKNGIFKSVILDGALPRKAFSMGEAEEKRFYMEARKIVE